MFSFYALVDGSTQALTLNTGANDVEISNVPLAQNKHIILSGDVANVGWTEFTFLATINENWTSSSTVEFP